VIPEKRSFVKCKEHWSIVEVSQVDLTSTDNHRYTGTEMLNFREPVFMNTA